MDRYRLAPVRDVRARAERVRQGDLASAVGDARVTEADVGRARGRVEALRTRIAAASTERATQLEAHPRPDQLVRAERFLARLRAELEGAIGALLRAEAAHAGKLAVIDEARGRLAVARAERQVIERHFARWREEKQKLAERRED